jgi:hypothetical protein
MRAIGFSEYTDRKKLKELLTDVIMNSDHRAYTMNQEGILLGEFSKNHTSAKGAVESGVFGVAVCGEFDDNDKFIYEYYFPYLTGSGITSYEDVSVERHADKDSYAGICDDIKVGISLIFYLRNRIPYIKAQSTGKLPIRGTTLTLSGLSLTGSILFPMIVSGKENTTINLGEPLRLGHRNGTKLSEFDDQLKLLYGKYQLATGNLIKLLKIDIANPVNCMKGVMDKLGISRKYAAEAVDLFIAQYGEDPCTD